ncbi:HMG box protein [Metarhizium album ARSEF 1941]|uniref:HMG box protein n=1 Tax=Metarhizium album (strain ARSEF 1941) TaxID=1081103 RepID=A0A0B2WLX3_METAS|nr:HMG box protein [Metarhizium album ARSEF 1941]KHN94487.1 HMG box protein [Metarhizium album ARSEF 1941]
MLTAIGRAAARRVLQPGRTAASRLTTRLPRGSVGYRSPNALSIFAAARALSVSARVRSPAKAPGSKTKKSSSTATKKKKATATKKKATRKKTKKAATPKKRTKKELTPEDKEKAELGQLKKMALLKGPSLLPDSAWSVYTSRNIGTGEGTLTDKIKGLSSRFAELSESQKEDLKSTAQSNQNANKTTRQKWVESQPVEAIYLANIARRRIARKTNKTRLFLIHDDRLPKRARSPYALFIKSRFSQVNSQPGSGTSQDSFRAMSEEWRSMSESEKQPFKEAAVSESEKSAVLFKDLKEKARAYWKAQGGAASQVPS